MKMMAEISAHLLALYSVALIKVLMWNESSNIKIVIFKKRNTKSANNPHKNIFQYIL